jgi:hypothetical protein
MCIVKDLLTKEELRQVRRALQILPEEAPVFYEVWAIGYANNSKQATWLRKFEEFQEAIAYADTVYLLDAITAITGNNRFNYDTDYVFVEVETVVEDTKGSTINISTIYKNDLFIMEHIG